MIRRFTLVLVFITCRIALAQSFEMFNKDTINLVDAEGRKQGFWIFFNRIKKLPCYKDEQKVEEGRFLNSKKIGKWKEYYCNGNLKNVITFDNNRPNGYAIMYHENGKIHEEGYWKNNRWVGNYKLYYENGQVAQEFKFSAMGKREGVQKYYYENGQVMIEGEWKEGKESGVIKEFYESGDLKAEKVFSDGMINPAASKTYEPKKPLLAQKNGSETPAEDAPKTITTVVKVDEKPNMPNQVFNGEGYWKLYNKNKQISKDGIFRKGRLIDGKVFHYSDDGILTRIAVYKDGVYVGDTVIEE